MRILYIEDEEEIAEIVAMALERAGYTVALAADGQEGLERAQEGGWSLILLDGMLPGLDGIEVCRRLRAQRDRTPLLMLTARDTVADQVKGLEIGADDYLPKPFAIELLLARVRALLRREGVQKGSVIRLRDLEIDLTFRQLTRAGQEVLLTPRQWDLLELLVRQEGRPVSRELILRRAWDAEERVGSNMVDVYINQLRKKLDEGAEVKLLRTLHGIGYALVRPAQERSEP